MGWFQLILVFSSVFLISHGKLQWVEINPDHEAVYTTEPDAHPPARKGHAVFCLGDDIFMFGGETQDGTKKRDFWKYEPESRRWLWLADGPGPGGRSNMAYWTNDLTGEFFIYGGSVHTVGPVNDFWHYVPSTRQWNPQPNVNGPGKRYNAAFWTDIEHGRLFLYGGQDETQIYSDLWHFDLNSHTWHAHPESNEPGPLINARAMQIENTVYLFGGQTNLNTGDVSGDLWKLDTSTLLWLKQELPQDTTSPEARAGHTLFATPTSDALLLMHGYHGGKVYGGNMWQLDPTANTWSKTSSGSYPARRYQAGYCTDAEGNTFVVGGAYNNVEMSNDVWQFGERSTFATIQQIFTFDLNYTNVALTYCVAMITICFFFAIAFAIASCILRYKRKREKMKMPIQDIGADF